MRSERDEELRNGREVKIDILEVLFRPSGQVSGSSVLYRGYQVMTSVSERGFGGPGKRWGALWAKGRGHISPLRG